MINTLLHIYLFRCSICKFVASVILATIFLTDRFLLTLCKGSKCNLRKKINLTCTFSIVVVVVSVTYTTTLHFCYYVL